LIKGALRNFPVCCNPKYGITVYCVNRLGCLTFSSKEYNMKKAVSVMSVAMAFAFTPNHASAQLLPPINPVPPQSVKYASGDIDGDGLFDVVASSRVDNVIKIWRATDDNHFALATSLPVPEAAAIVLADFDGDGFVDLAFGSHANNSVTIAYGSGDFVFAPDDDIVVNISPGILVSFDRCEGLLPEILVSNDSQSTFVIIESPTWHPVVNLVTPTFELPDCPGRGAGDQPCDDYTEPECEPDSDGDGIQECMRAANCRAEKCHWAACIEYEDGGWLLTRRLRWAAQNAACGAVHGMELSGCLAAVLPLN
jgi:VCBS repeat protein